MNNKIPTIGIDSVEIERFKQWHTYPKKSLLRIFSEEEIAYCLQSPAKSAERFAARFAVRESFFKALHQAIQPTKIPFLTLCKAIATHITGNGSPQIIVDWDLLNREPMHCSVSWTHTNTIATAIVLIH